MEYFKQLGETDPYRLDNMDTYSNLLYVKEHRVELAHLAHRSVVDVHLVEPPLRQGAQGRASPPSTQVSG